MTKKGLLTILIVDLIYLLLLYYFSKSVLFITLFIMICFIAEALTKGGNNNENIR